jgi:hypothetical protein
MLSFKAFSLVSLASMLLLINTVSASLLTYNLTNGASCTLNAQCLSGHCSWGRVCYEKNALFLVEQELEARIELVAQDEVLAMGYFEPENRTDGASCRINTQCGSGHCSWGGVCYTKPAGLLNLAEEKVAFLQEETSTETSQEVSGSSSSFLLLAMVALASMWVGSYLQAWRMNVKSRLEDGFLSCAEYEKLHAMMATPAV